jgi:tRNA A-37 threonylcarbamoyl transferase component Bud32
MLADGIAMTSAKVTERRGKFVIYHDLSSVHVGLISALLPDPDSLFAAGQAIESPWQSAATDKTVVSIGGRNFFFKRYNCLGGGYRLKNIFRNSRALKSWRAGWKFLDMGLPTPRPIACLEERHFRFLGRSYLLLEFLEDSRCLLDLWGDLPDNQRSQLLSLIGTNIGNMHRQGVLHGDLNWRNFLVSSAGEKREVFLVDLDGCRFLKSLSRKRAIRDLAHFLRDLNRNGASESDRALFLGTWQASAGFPLVIVPSSTNL